MNIGIDFDNTIVDYTGVFYHAALQTGWIPPSVKSDKTSVRDYLRQQGQENQWIELQGLVYGPHIFSAKPFPGVAQFLEICRKKEINVFIISHKTRYPFMGESHDLHTYALKWLERNHFFDAIGGLSLKNVFLELTKQEKLSRIAQLNCEYFLDDLPEFLTDPGFPSGVKRILFDPHHSHEQTQEYQRVTSWDAFIKLLS